MKRILSILLLFPLALNAMDEQAIVAPPTNYKLEEVLNFGDTDFYQQLQINVSLSDAKHTATDTVRQFVSQRGTYIPSNQAKDVATVSLDSGYSAKVIFGAILNDDIS